MPAYVWQALDTEGKNRKGTQEADSPKSLRQHLRAQGLTPLSVTELSNTSNKNSTQSKSFNIRLTSSIGKLSTQELSIMTRQLATLLKSGLPIDSALTTMVQQMGKSRSKNLLVAVRAKILEGYTLAQALSNYEHIFPDHYVATVAAGEKSGKVGMVLERLSENLQTAHAIKNKVTLALIYPMFILFVGIGVIIALLTFVVPDILKVFENVDQQLPTTTQILIALSSFFRDWGEALLLLLAIIFVTGKLLLRNESILYGWHSFLLKLPLYGRLLKETSIARFTRTLSILLESHVDITDSMRIAANVVAPLPIKEALLAAGDQVKEGKNVNSALAETGYLSPILLSLIASGEKSGSLSNMLKQGADNQEEETLTTISIIVGVFEPVMILLMGTMVLFIVLAILVPIFDMNTFIK
jgi:general secretion pathway protein F